jgi:hypothetical protein
MSKKYAKYVKGLVIIILVKDSMNYLNKPIYRFMEIYSFFDKKLNQLTKMSLREKAGTFPVQSILTDI